MHTRGRNREAIWDAVQRREVYGTSGPRILLWFDLVNASADDAPVVPMGGQTQMSENPRFVVRALGSFEQKPGCPPFAEDALGTERLERLCRGECYHPSDQRKRITRIEIVRILPQQLDGEPISPLITDPWKTIPCPADGNGCSAEFEDPEFSELSRDSVYYARAIQEPRETINAGGLRCEYNSAGECIAVDACFGDDRTAANDDCSGLLESQAWSSPIFVDYLATP